MHDLGSRGLADRERIAGRERVFQRLRQITLFLDGALRLTMISDDNFQFFQRTEWVDYKPAP